MIKVLCGDALEKLTEIPTASVNCCVTSPPYFGLRDYGVTGQIGLEPTPDEYVGKLVEVFREVRRVLRDDGTLWLNLGDSYAGSGKGRRADGTHQEGGKQGSNKGTILGLLVKTKSLDCKPKDLIGIPWRVAFALQADGWYLRQDIIWHKPNPMPESVKDRCTKSHEYLFLLSKSEKYYFDADAVKEDAVGGSKGAAASFKRTNSKRGDSMCPHSPTPTHRANREDIRYDGETRNRRSVWTIATRPYKEAHFAVFPPALVEPCIMAGCPAGGVVLDPFAGSGTTLQVAIDNGRDAIGIELNPSYIHLIEKRVGVEQ